jgi:hypothetical protein
MIRNPKPEEETKGDAEAWRSIFQKVLYIPLVNLEVIICQTNEKIQGIGIKGVIFRPTVGIPSRQ